MIARGNAVRALLFLLVLLAGACAYAPCAQAQASKHKAIGIWPDIALSLGGGIGIGHPIATNVYGSARLGLLFAYEPWVINLGVSGELGALPKHGLGAEFELNYLRGPFVNVGYDRISGGDWMTRLTVGFALFGVQWQHRLSSTPPDNAILFLLRLPLGIGWFFLHDQQRRQREPPDRQPISETHDG